MTDEQKAAYVLVDAPIENRYRKEMIALAQSLDEVLNGDKKGSARETGFILLVFPFGGHEGRCNYYISNGADRRDVIVLLKEQLARFEGQAEMKGTA